MIILIVLLSSIKLAVDTYESPEWDPKIHSILELIDIIFNVIFIVESVFKIITYGFVLDKNSYLRNSWNILDFFIALNSIENMIFKNEKIEIIHILKLLRTLRPLRFLSHFENLKVVINSIISSLSGILNVLVVVFLVWLMFGILGINLMGNKMGHCHKDDPTFDIFGVNKTNCL